MDKLSRFTNDTPTRKAVYNFIIESLTKELVRKGFNGESTEGFKEAKVSIDKAFKELEIAFIKEEKKQATSYK